MLVKEVIIPFDNNDMTVEFRKEDGMPQIRFDSEGSSFVIGTHDKFDSKVLRELASAMEELARNLEVDNKEKMFVIHVESTSDPSKKGYIDKRGDLVSNPDCAPLFTEKEALGMANSVRGGIAKIFAKVIVAHRTDVFRETKEKTFYPMGYYSIGATQIVTSVNKNILKKYNIFNNLVQKIEDSVDEKFDQNPEWNWNVQLTPMTFLIEMKYDKSSIYSDVCFSLIDLEEDGLPNLSLCFPSKAARNRYWFIYNDEVLSVDDLEKIIGARTDYTIYTSNDTKNDVKEILIASDSEEFKDYMFKNFDIILNSGY